MIFNISTLLLFFIVSTYGILQGYNMYEQVEDHSNDVRYDASTKRTLAHPIKQNLVVDDDIDLDNNGEAEVIKIYTTLGNEIGDENTKIYINNQTLPALDLGGYFDGMDVHTINPQGEQIFEIRTASGHSINTEFYSYVREKLELTPVSSAKPPSFYGIVSRNRPEMKDIDGDNILEMIAYYRHFPPEKERTVEVYKYNSGSFLKSTTYEEVTEGLYL